MRPRAESENWRPTRRNGRISQDFVDDLAQLHGVENCSSAEAAVDSLAADEESEALRQQNFEDRLAEFNKTLSNLAADLDDVATGISENLR